MASEVSVTITRQDRYRFLVDFGDGIPPGAVDEPPPLGENAGGSPTMQLAAAVASCLSASFIFACNKFKEDPGGLTTTATCNIDRNEKNRLRVSNIDVRLNLGAPPETLDHLDRILAQFEEFCTVTQSVRAGIPIAVRIAAPDGTILK
jgi:organic hydroperoxide reductase OsmC/OhrA